MSDTPHLPLQDYCRQITELFQQAISQPDPALFLHHKDARQPLFMAESLVRVLYGISHSKKAEKALKFFKKLEDALGKIEENDTFIKEFSKKKAIKKTELAYFMKKRAKALTKLNAQLLKSEFYQDDFNRTAKLLLVNFNDKRLLLKAQAHIHNELAACYTFYRQCGTFTDMEAQVHEIRRKLRWISMYGRSFNGAIALAKDNTRYTWEKQFHLATEIKSPYGKLPVNKNLTAHIAFNQKAFYALNYVVSALGKLKDKGLGQEDLAKAIHKTANQPKEAARALAAKKLGLKHTEAELLQEAHHLLKDFFDTHGIHKLLL